MSTFVGKQTDRSVEAQKQKQTYAERVDCYSMQSSTFTDSDFGLTGDNFHLDPSHPNNHPGAKLVLIR